MTPEEFREYLRAMEMSHIFVVVVVTGEYTFVTIYCTTYYKCVHLYVNYTSTLLILKNHAILRKRKTYSYKCLQACQVE